MWGEGQGDNNATHETAEELERCQDARPRAAPPDDPAEGLLWQRLRHRKLGAKFRRQVPIGPFIVDFYCHEARLVVEVDGEAHADESQAALDAARTEWLEDEGHRVLRVKNAELIGETDAVIARIQRELPLSR